MKSESHQLTITEGSRCQFLQDIERDYQARINPFLLFAEHFVENIIDMSEKNNRENANERYEVSEI